MGNRCCNDTVEPSQTPLVQPQELKPRGKGTSNSEDRVYRCLVELLLSEFDIKSPVIYRNYRPGFLKSTETGKNLELDMYIPYAFSSPLALEYNGYQHYEYPNVYHKTLDQFIKLQHNDVMKVEACKREGVVLIQIHYLVDNERSNGKKRTLRALSDSVKVKKLKDYLRGELVRCLHLDVKR
jgi:hypothetical protein